MEQEDEHTWITVQVSKLL